MPKVSNIKAVTRKILECTKSVNVSFNNVNLATNELMKKKVCLVTGASRGIGKAVAKELLNCGATVVGIARDESKLKACSKEFSTDRFHFFACDLSDVENISQYIDEIRSMISYQFIDVLINCAGVKNGNDERFFDYTHEDFDDVLGVNIKAPFFWSQAIAKQMIENGIRGHIVNVASIKGFIGEASPYGISKWGCVCLTKGLGRLLGNKGIVVNGVAPGGTATDMAPYKEGDSLAHLTTPSLRLSLPEEIAKIIVFLASDLGNSIVGEVIIADGGQVTQYGPSRNLI
ncbi:MAG: SDR family oxidoreductase [Lachnospiraceae bacterium]|nr:SDR family oxidoreductase [Lachnospiraceae bacterium]